jgi:hypothetical protein
MLLIHEFLVPVGVGVPLWLVNAYLPLDAKIKKILDIVVVIAVVPGDCVPSGPGLPLGDSRREVNYSGTSLFQRTTRGKEGKDEGSWSPPSLTLQKLLEVETV